MEALDDKEYSGSLVSLLQEGTNFVKNNSKKRWRKTGNGRIEMPEYMKSLLMHSFTVTIRKSVAKSILIFLMIDLKYILPAVCLTALLYKILIPTM